MYSQTYLVFHHLGRKQQTSRYWRMRYWEERHAEFHIYYNNVRNNRVLVIVEDSIPDLCLTCRAGHPPHPPCYPRCPPCSLLDEKRWQKVVITEHLSVISYYQVSLLQLESPLNFTDSHLSDIQLEAEGSIWPICNA